MIILPDHRIVFLEIPRTASQAMKRFFLAHMGGVDLSPHDHHYFALPPKYKGFKVLCGVRNPYSRVYSRFMRLKKLLPATDAKMKQRKKVGFAEYVRGGRGEPIRRFLEIAGVPKIDVVIKFEELPESFFRAVHDIDPIVQGDFPNINVPVGAGWQQFYTQAKADLVWRATQTDFVDFGYKRDSWRAT